MPLFIRPWSKRRKKENLLIYLCLCSTLSLSCLEQCHLRIFNQIKTPQTFPQISQCNTIIDFLIWGNIYIIEDLPSFPLPPQLTPRPKTVLALSNSFFSNFQSNQNTTNISTNLPNAIIDFLIWGTIYIIEDPPSSLLPPQLTTRPKTVFSS